MRRCHYGPEPTPGRWTGYHAFIVVLALLLIAATLYGLA